VPGFSFIGAWNKFEDRSNSGPAHLTEDSSPHILRLQAGMNRLRRDNAALHKQNAALQAQVQKQSETFQAALQSVLQQLQIVRVELQNRQRRPMFVCQSNRPTLVASSHGPRRGKTATVPDADLQPGPFHI